MDIATNKSINPAEVYGRINKQTVGSVVLHFGVVREKTDDKTSKSVEFRRIGDIEDELKSITDTIRKKCAVEDILIIHRLGLLHVGDVIENTTKSIKLQQFRLSQAG